MTDSIDMIATDRALKARHRTMWALGDYPAVATDMIAELGPVLVAASGVRRGQRVLDVAAGSGNAAVPAALTGAEVVPPSSHPSCSPQAARSPRGRVASWSGPRETCSSERGLLNLGLMTPTVEQGMAYHHVDVFADQPLGGNGLIVVLGADHLPSALMQEVTREMRQFESIFLSAVDLPSRMATARIFTLDEELSFAGHPVLGAAAVLHSLVGDATSATWQIRVADRPLIVQTHTQGDRMVAEMNQGAGTVGTPLSPGQAARFLQALNLDVEDGHPQLPLQPVSTGLPYLIVPIRDGLERAAITRPDFENLLADCGAKFVYVLDPARPEGRTWDNAGKVEDIATGSAAGPVGLYLRHHQWLRDERVTLNQGRFTGRPSAIDIRIDPRNGDVWVGGQVTAVAHGRFVEL